MSDKSRNQNRVDETGHLDLKGYLQFAGIIENYNDKLSGANLLIILSPRDVGKSTAAWKLAFENWENSEYKNKCLYLRNNLTKIKNYMKSFNGKYAPEFSMSESAIYKFDIDANNKVLNKKYIGACVPLSTYENFKSIDSEGFNLLIWDEFNEEDNLSFQNWNYAKNNHNLFYALIDTITTFERHRGDFSAIVIGNKVSTENDILLKLDIEDDPNATDDQLFIRDVKIGDKLIKIRVVIAHENTFKKIKGADSTLAKALATYDINANRYLNNGGFLQDRCEDVISWCRIKDSSSILKYLTYDSYFFELGNFENDEKYYIREVHQTEINHNYEILSLDIISYITNIDAESLLNIDDYIHFYEFLCYNIKYKNLFFTTNFAKIGILTIMKNLLSLTND